MGWVSFREDLVEALTVQLEELRVEVVRREGAHDRSGEFLQGWIARAEAILCDLRQHLELATDPDVDLACQVSALEQKCRRLEQTVAAIKGETKVLQKEKERTIERYEETKRELKSAEKANRLLRAKFDEVMRRYPNDVYDLYSSPDRIGRLKPEV